MPLASFPLGPIQTNSYILHKERLACAIDVGGDPAPILNYLKKYDLTLKAICITHLHFDHIYGVEELRSKTNAPVYTPKGDFAIANTEASLGGIWGFPRVQPFTHEDLPSGHTTFANMHCIVLDTPGHTPGGVSFYFPDEKIVFSGDALFYHSIGRTDFPLGDTDTLLTSIRKNLFSLPNDTRVCPGHGPETTIQEERAHNPICGDELR